MALEAALFRGKETKVVKDFRCCDVPRSPEDRTELVQNVADIFMGSVQYNEEGVMLTIAQICDIMTNQSQGEAYDRLVQLAAVWNSAFFQFLPLILIEYQFSKSTFIPQHLYIESTGMM